MYVSVSERLIECVNFLLESRQLRNQAELVAILGKSKGYVSQILSGKKEPSGAVVECLCEHFPDISQEWILTGEGEMRRKDHVALTNLFKGADNTVPLLPIFAQAGHLTGWSESVTEVECERVISPVKDIDMAVHIYGESMYPDIPNGSVVYVRKVTGGLVEWGSAYILDTVDGPVLKYLTPGSDDLHIKCISANHDPKFAPFEVPVDNILGMYRVVMCMKMM